MVFHFERRAKYSYVCHEINSADCDCLSKAWNNRLYFYQNHLTI